MAPLLRNKKAPRMFGAQNQGSVKSEVTKKSRKQSAFSGQSNQTRVEPTSFFYPDYTVGSVVATDHAQALAGCTADRELHPAPKVRYSVNWIITQVGHV